jgi:CRISPR-associated protein Csx10
MQARDARFDDFFMGDKIRFGNLYPVKLNHLKSPVKPLPNTARSCKRWGGFKYRAKEDWEEGQEERHGVTDHLILWLLFVLSDNINILRQNEACGCPLDIFKYHGRCEERLDRFDGFYRMHAPGQCEKSELKSRLLTRTGINRATGTVEKEILYNLKVIAEDQVFQGIIQLDDAVETEFINFIRDKSLHLRAGNSKTRGLGKLELAEEPGEPLSLVSLEDFTTRVKNFDSAVKVEAGKYNVDVGNRFFFAITCCSDVIIREPDLRYRTALTAEYLEQVLGIRGLKLHYQSASVLKISGWNALWRLPRTVEPAIEKGSVFLFEYPGAPHDELFTKLYHLELEGLGSRKTEGFGWISISDDFHREVHAI